MIELVTTLICHPNLYRIIQFGTFPLINSLSHYMLLSKSLEISWVNDDNHFIIDDQESQIYTIRNIALKLISHLIENHRDIAIQGVLTVAERFLFESGKNIDEFVEQFMGSMNLEEHESYLPEEFN